MLFWLKNAPYPKNEQKDNLFSCIYVQQTLSSQEYHFQDN